MDDTSPRVGTSPPAIAADRFRYVLGQHPTGVTLITARRADGEPVGMVVGTFNSVSLEPPLVTFIADRKSSSWPQIRASGAFCANILTAAQQEVCRAFARKHPDRFAASTWLETAVGSPRLEGVAAWIACTIEEVVSAGDHEIVLGRVQALDVGDSTDLPLLFLRGGYGSFSIPSIESLETDLPRHVRAIDVARNEIESLAEELHLECLVSVAAEDMVVVVSAAGVESSPHGAPSRVGVSFPLAAPIAPVHVAWAGHDAERRWLAHARKVAGSVEASAARRELALVRDRGYAVSTGIATAEAFERSLRTASNTAMVADLTDILPDILNRAGTGAGQLSQAREVTSLHAPVFDQDGKVVISLTINGFGGTETPERLQSVLDRLLAGARRIGAQLSRGPSGPARG